MTRRDNHPAAATTDSHPDCRAARIQIAAPYAQELRCHSKGQTLDQVLAWVTRLYGFLSSPTSGGVRHGADIKNLVELPKSDAQLYCNLIRSYVTYLIAEHERMSRVSNPFL